jgi:hypothetical protein
VHLEFAWLCWPPFWLTAVQYRNVFGRRRHLPSPANFVAVSNSKTTMTKETEAKLAAEGEEEEEVFEGADIFYVPKKTLQEIKDKLAKNEDVTKELVLSMVDIDEVPDDEPMVPIDMRGCADQLQDDIEQMLETLGPKGAAEALVKCEAYFKENKDNEPADERPAEMTAAEWRDHLASGMMEGEEEALLDEDDEEEADEDAAEAEEPPAKKAKTDE